MQVGLGEFLHQLDDKLPNSPVPIDDVLAAVLLIFFGVQTLRVSSRPMSALPSDCWNMSCMEQFDMLHDGPQPDGHGV